MSTTLDVVYAPGKLLSEVLLGKTEHVYIIAEIGINHDGSLQTALELIEAAKNAGVDAVKFQKRHLPSIYNAGVIEDPNSQEWNIEYLINELKEVELSLEDYKTIQESCEALELDLIITPFDISSADFVFERGVVAFKNASCNMTNLTLLDHMISKKIPLLISTGMWSDVEIKYAAEYLEAKGAIFSLLLSNSTYPCPYEDISLSYLHKLKEYCPRTVVGYSGHERGTFIPVAAVAMGARIIEKHITFDKNKTGLDHKASMEPSEWAEMVSNIRLLQTSMGTSKAINQAELLARQSFCLSPYAARDISKGSILTEEDFILRAPGKGLFQHQLDEYLLKPVCIDIHTGVCISESHFSKATMQIADWKIAPFKKKWGVKCRFHDFLEYSVLSSPVVEFHCSQKDIYDSISGICSETSQLIVHAPEIVDRMLVDICSSDAKQMTLSLNILQDTINRTVELSKGFSGKPKLVVHFGGMQLDEAVDSKTLRRKLLDRAIESFKKLNFDPDEIEILPENLPPKPWYLGGEWNQYGFMTVEDMMEFCDTFDLKMTFDICHAQLYCKSCDTSLVEYTKKVKSRVSHLHISDATGVNGEGVQMHEGDIDFEGVLCELVDVDCSWVTEIWAGHTDNGQGTYKSMTELEKYLKFL
jgi:sialic acid synthase SpsE/sugar phosphate isomerase/epimerase